MRREQTEWDVTARTMDDAVSFEQIRTILDVTDQLGVNREGVEIPLTATSPGAVRRLANGKLEIVVDAGVPFGEWLAELPDHIRALPPFASSYSTS